MSKTRKKLKRKIKRPKTKRKRKIKTLTKRKIKTLTRKKRGGGDCTSLIPLAKKYYYNEKTSKDFTKHIYKILEGLFGFISVLNVNISQNSPNSQKNLDKIRSVQDIIQVICEKLNFNEDSIGYLFCSGNDQIFSAFLYNLITILGVNSVALLNLLNTIKELQETKQAKEQELKTLADTFGLNIHSAVLHALGTVDDPTSVKDVTRTVSEGIRNLGKGLYQIGCQTRELAGRLAGQSTQQNLEQFATNAGEFRDNVNTNLAEKVNEAVAQFGETCQRSEAISEIGPLAGKIISLVGPKIIVTQSATIDQIKNIIKNLKDKTGKIDKSNLIGGQDFIREFRVFLEKIEEFLSVLIEYQSTCECESKLSICESQRHNAIERKTECTKEKICNSSQG